MMTVNEYLMLPAEVRRTIDLTPKPRGRYRSRSVREKWRSDEEKLIAYLCDQDLKSAGQLKRHRRRHRDGPTVDDYIAAFGSWQAAKEAAFGKAPPEPFTPEVTATYIVKTAIMFDLRTRDAWLEARRQSDAVPSINQVRKEFGTFTKLVRVCRMASTEWGLERYLELAKQKGRLLTAYEMMENGINLTELSRLHGGRGNRNWFLGKMLKMYESRTVQNSEWLKYR